MRKGSKNSYKVTATNTGNSKATGAGVSATGKGELKPRYRVGFGRHGQIGQPQAEGVEDRQDESKFKVTSDNAGGKTVKKKVTVVK